MSREGWLLSLWFEHWVQCRECAGLGPGIGTGCAAGGRRLGVVKCVCVCGGGAGGGGAGAAGETCTGSPEMCQLLRCT